MDNETTITPLAIITHSAVRAFKHDRGMDNARAVMRSYFRLLGSIGSAGVVWELSGVERDLVYRAAEMTHRPMQNR